MRPLIVPLAAFRLFDAAVTRRKVPFSNNRVFAEFSSLIEALLLYNDIRYFNVGAFNFEWLDGPTIPKRGQDAHNPFEAFHGIDFIKEAPLEFMGKGKELLKMASQKEMEKIFNQEFGTEPRHEFSLWTYLSTYVQAYNGDFGSVTVKEYPLVQNLLGRVLYFEHSKAPVAKDPLIIQSYEKLKSKYEEKLRGISEIAITPIPIPPVTAILLSHLPDSVSDPHIVVREILDMRRELALLRKRFSDLEDALYSDDATINDFRVAKDVVEADAKALTKKFGKHFCDNVSFRWYVDLVSFIAKILIKWKVEKEEIIALVASKIPKLGDWLGVSAPSLLFNMAMKTQNIKGYGNLVQRKLGLTLEK